jgi:hypothetical protein
MTAAISIGTLLAQVPTGEDRLFRAPITGAIEERFFKVHSNRDYILRPDWQNQPSMEQAPWTGARTMQRISLSTLPAPFVTFEGASEDLTDFYSTGGHVWFLSDRLVTLIETLDPGSLDRLPMTIETQDNAIPFHAVMPARNIEAVDPMRTDVRIVDKSYAGHWVRSVDFPETVVFQSEVVKNLHTFSDIDIRGWFWSRELIEAAIKACIKGLYTTTIGGRSRQVHRL